MSCRLGSIFLWKRTRSHAAKSRWRLWADATKNLVATYCTTTNTLFVHNKKTVNKAAFVYTQNAEKIIRNLNAAQQNAFSNLAATYMQSAKQFVINKLAQSTILKS